MKYDKLTAEQRAHNFYDLAYRSQVEIPGLSEGEDDDECEIFFTTIQNIKFDNDDFVYNCFLIEFNNNRHIIFFKESETVLSYCLFSVNDLNILYGLNKSLNWVIESGKNKNYTLEDAETLLNLMFTTPFKMRNTEAKIGSISKELEEQEELNFVDLKRELLKRKDSILDIFNERKKFRECDIEVLKLNIDSENDLISFNKNYK